MLIPNKFNGYQADGSRILPIGGGVGEAMLFGAAMGGGSAAITGGDPLKGALLGGLTGGVGAGLPGALTNALGGTTASTLLSTAAPEAATAATAAGTAGAAGGAGIAGLPTAMLPQVATETATSGITALPGATASAIPTSALPVGMPLPPAGGIEGVMPFGSSGSVLNPASPLNPPAVADIAAKKVTLPFVGEAPGSAPYMRLEAANPVGIYNASPEAVSQAMNAGVMNPTALPLEVSPTGSGALVGEGATSGVPKWDTAMRRATTSSMSPMESFKQAIENPLGYIKENPFKMGAAALAGAVGGREPTPEEEEYTGPLSRFRFNPNTYRPAAYADGGIASLPANYDRIVGEMPMYQRMARGGMSDLGSYSDGGRMLRGPGDGMSDNIPGVIGGKRPARLADGEFVVPADVVSHLGNGSTDAGAKQLYAMMDRVRAKRTGTKKQGRQINPRKYMPA